MNNKSIFETLEAKEAKLEAKLNKLRNKNDEAVKAKNNALNEVLKSYFSPIESSLEDMRLQATYGTSMEITARGDEYEKEVWSDEKEDYVTKKLFRTKEVATIKVQEYSRWDNSTKEAQFTDMGISSYSTSDYFSDFNNERLRLTGEYAMVIQDHKDNILAEMNKVWDDHNEKVSKTQEAVNKCNNEIRSIQDQRKAFRNDIIIDDLKAGIKILDDKTAYIQERFDCGVNNIVEAKITRMSYSGKSADLEVKTKGRRWDNEADAYVDTIYDRKLTKVRIQNILDSFVTSYNGLTWERV